MNFFKKWIFKFGFLAAALVIISACSQDTEILSYDNNDKIDEEIENKSKELTGSCIVQYNKETGLYSSAAINIPNGSFIRIPSKSLVPPSELKGTDVEIAMEVDVNFCNKEILFTFGPHGCEFTSPAELCLSWKDLGIQKANLYYLDDENKRIEHLPDQVDDSKKRMILYINHFSRYAVAYSN